MLLRSVGVLAVLSVLLFDPTRAAAQDSRGAVTGRVVDTQGGVLPGVTVTVVNTGTNSTTAVTTNESGQYNALFLIPGNYSVKVELSGFRTAINERVTVRVGERLQLDFTMDPGGVTEEVQVVAETPQLETGTASMGPVINSKLISEIPLGDGTAYGLTRLVPGATFERSYALQRPMDNDNLRGLSVTGTINSEFTIDGSSNIVSSGSPPAASSWSCRTSGRRARTSQFSKRSITCRSSSARRARFATTPRRHS